MVLFFLSMFGPWDPMEVTHSIGIPWVNLYHGSQQSQGKSLPISNTLKFEVLPLACPRVLKTECHGELFVLHPKLLQDFTPDKNIESYEQLLKICRRLQRTRITVSHGKLFPTGSFSMGNYLPRDPFPLEISFSWDPMCNTNSWENFLHGTLVPMGNLR